MKPTYLTAHTGKPRVTLSRPAFDLALAGALAFLAWLLVSQAAHAATESTEFRCVSDSAQLADALLNNTQSPNVNIAIRVRQGTYTVSGINATFAAPMSIRGGWSDIDCNDNSVRTINPGNTIIDLAGSKFTLKQPEGPSRASVVVEGVTFRNGDSIEISSGTIHALSNDPGDLTIQRSRFTGFSPAATPFATVDFSVATGTGFLENVLIDHVTATNAPTCAVGLAVDGASANFGINYVTADISGSVCLTNGPSAWVSNSFVISNSVIWSSESAPPEVAVIRDSEQSSIAVSPAYSIIHLVKDQNGNPIVPPAFPGQIDADPEWNSPVSGDYGLNPGSPGVDTGVVNVPLGLPATDMVGQMRPSGPLPDLGALEWNGSAIPTAIVSNTNDGGAGSLRQAILDANANANPLVEIVFQVPGSCPQTIALQSTLPNIAKGVRINGYTQTDSKPNYDSSAFDANLCVILKPASGTLPFAFRVPAGADGASQLQLSGVALGGFDQPILLLGGGEHKITGVQIGGNVNGISLPGPSTNGISVATGSVGGIYVGGPSPTERNVIGGSALGNAINIQPGGNTNLDQCRIVNNLIGLTQNGSTQLLTSHGINLSGTGCRVSGNRIVTASDAIWINGGSSNLIQGNTIGFNIDGSPFFNSGAGVLITGGTDNVIGGRFGDGMTSGSPLANDIRNMTLGGVIAKNGSLRNAIRGNTLINVGGSAGPIDLVDGAFGEGPTPNDFDDLDSGPNNLKNFATIRHLAYIAPAVPGAHDVQAYVFGQLLGSEAGVNRIDAYFYNGACGPGERGRAERYIGSFIAFTFASGNPSNFNYAMTLPNIAADGAIAFTATDSDGNTSELGTCYRVGNAPTWDDVIFWDDLE